MGAVLACGDGAALSHRSAGALWGFITARRGPIEVSAHRGRRRAGILAHACVVTDDDTAALAGIPVTTVARTLLDLAEVLKATALEEAFDEADRLKLLSLDELEGVCRRARGRRGLKPLRRLMDADRGPETRSPLEDRLVAFCRKRGLPEPETNVTVLGREVDAFWPDAKLMAEADSFEFHSHRGAFEGDRARDAAMVVAGYRVVRITHRRLTREPEKLATELRLLLAGGVGDS
jgi:very-short-patch-repair endonuclease